MDGRIWEGEKKVKGEEREGKRGEKREKKGKSQRQVVRETENEEHM